MITRNLSSGEQILIFDNVFSYNEVSFFEGHASKCFFRVIEVDSYKGNSRSSNESFFGSVFSSDDIKSFGIFETKGFKKISHCFEDMIIQRSWILSADSSSKYLYHYDDFHNSSLTFLYYLNSFWHPEWGGETLFCDSYGEPELAVACKPNRVVVFPSIIPHKPSGVSKDSRLRYSFTTTFIKNNEI